jgi:hypothetical protein
LRRALQIHPIAFWLLQPPLQKTREDEQALYFNPPNELRMRKNATMGVYPTNTSARYGEIRALAHLLFLWSLSLSLSFVLFSDFTPSFLSSFWLNNASEE